ncbi:CHRD domain-containing protein [Sphingosinicella terrae]|uniref:CHRD domain-containing protein n=1 Tax=Sphingosinicella terrae TaxID=2172047 RepID=UPI000E0DF841|nr:CHRD domain-containing protein [Sphingosinicella terrae]
MFDIRKSRMLAAMAATALVATPAMAAEFRAVLTDHNLTGVGDPDGWGRARVRIDDSFNILCTDLEVRSIDEVLSAQIHRGTEGTEGPPVVNLDAPDDEDSDDCDNVGDTLADEIQANPAGFYVLVKTREHPEGAIRGQLGPSSG